VDQARKVEPYSEALTRAAMQVAAAAGDARRLHLEWRECRRQVDDLDPGGTPSDVTERLYVSLRAQLGAGCTQPTSTPIVLAH
jgi:DNA-binding SARP family transcriptional activator